MSTAIRKYVWSYNRVPKTSPTYVLTLTVTCMLSFLFEKWSEMYNPLCKVKSQSLHKIYKMLNTLIKVYVVEAKSVDYLLFIFVLTLIIFNTTCQRKYIFNTLIAYYIQSCTIYICRFLKMILLFKSSTYVSFLCTLQSFKPYSPCRERQIFHYYCNPPVKSHFKQAIF